MVMAAVLRATAITTDAAVATITTAITTVAAATTQPAAKKHIKKHPMFGCFFSLLYCLGVLNMVK